MSITPDTIGRFVDSVAGRKRSKSAVCGRVIEEVVELGLASGLSSAQILAHVADALHNQALKASSKNKVTVFPSQLAGDTNEFPEKCADVSLVLKDLCYVGNVNLALEEDAKHAKFVKKSFRVTEQGTLYAAKPHVIT